MNERKFEQNTHQTKRSRNRMTKKSRRRQRKKKLLRFCVVLMLIAAAFLIFVQILKINSSSFYLEDFWGIG